MFFPCPNSKSVGKKKVISWWKYLKNQRIMRHNRILPPGKSKATLTLGAHQFSSQTEHYLMSSPGARYSASWTRNASAYRGWVVHPRGLTATSSMLTKPSETVVAGSKVPSALPANTRDVCVALGLVCACSCEQETVSSRIPAKKRNLKHGL